MPSLIDLRRRVRAVKNTQQITKAMKMVAASKLRRAQERIMNARPYALQMQRVLGSVASRVDPSIHPLLAARETRPEQQDAGHHRVGRQGALRQLQHEHHQGRGRFVAESAGAVHARPGRPEGARLLRPPRLRGAVRADRHLPEAAVRGRAGDRADGDRGVRVRARSTAWCWCTTSSSP